MPLQHLTAKDINAALADAHTRNDPHWTLRTMDAGLLNRMDQLLVRDQHPLCYQPGTQENRFVALARAGHQFEEQ